MAKLPPNKCHFCSQHCKIKVCANTPALSETDSDSLGDVIYKHTGVRLRYFCFICTKCRDSAMHICRNENRLSKAIDNLKKRCKVLPTSLTSAPLIGTSSALEAKEESVDRQPVDKQPVDKQPVDKQPVDKQLKRRACDKLDEEPVAKQLKKDKKTQVSTYREDTGFKLRAIQLIRKGVYYQAMNTLIKNSKRAKFHLCRVVTSLCSKEYSNLKKNFCLLKKPITMESIEQFQWEDITKELRENAPFLYAALMGKRKQVRPAHFNRRLAHTISLHLFAKFPAFKNVQSLHGVEMRLTGTNRGMITDFQHLGICMGQKASITLIERLTTNYDAKLNRWRQSIEELHQLDKSLEDAENEFPGYQLWWGVENQGIARYDTHDTVIERNDFTEPHAIAFAVKNRVGAVDFPETNVKATDIPLKDLLPSLEDVDSFKQRMKIIVARILIDHLPEHFDDFDVVEHIRHPFLEESAQKSEMVHLGVIPENPEKTKGTKEILRRLHQYVPNINGDVVPIPVNGDMVTMEMCLHDQDDAEIPEDGLEGLVPVPQEFSKRQQHLQDTMDIFFYGKSYTQQGTLAHIRHKFRFFDGNFKTVNGNVQEQFQSHADFLRFVAEGMTVLLARKLLNDCDSPEMDSESLENIASKIVEEIWYPVEDHINKTLNAPTEDEFDHDDNGESHLNSPLFEEEEDYVRNYSRALLWRALSHLVHRDALRENDGNAIISHWHLDMFDFAARNHETYMKQAHNLIAGVQGVFPLKLSHEITWNRTVNVLGGPGYNLEMDLVEQFINFHYKDKMQHCRDINLEKRGKMIGLVRNLEEPLNKFYQRDTDTSRFQMKHLLDRDNRNDIKVFIKEYEKENLFDFIPGREHRSFPKFKYNLNVDYKDLKHKLLTFSEEMDKKRILFRHTGTDHQKEDFGNP